MAVKVLTAADARAYNTGVLATPEAATVALDGFELTADGDYILICQNVNAGADYKLTLKYGDAMQGTADVEITSILRSTTQVVKIDSGYFKNVGGTNKGKILLIPEHVDLKVKAVRF